MHVIRIEQTRERIHRERAERAHHFRGCSEILLGTFPDAHSLNVARKRPRRYDGNARASPPGHGRAHVTLCALSGGTSQTHNRRASGPRDIDLRVAKRQVDIVVTFEKKRKKKNTFQTDSRSRIGAKMITKLGLVHHLASHAMIDQLRIPRSIDLRNWKAKRLETDRIFEISMICFV